MPSAFAVKLTMRTQCTQQQIGCQVYRVGLLCVACWSRSSRGRRPKKLRQIVDDAGLKAFAVKALIHVGIGAVRVFSTTTDYGPGGLLTSNSLFPDTYVPAGLDEGDGNVGFELQTVSDASELLNGLEQCNLPKVLRSNAFTRRHSARNAPSLSVEYDSDTSGMERHRFSR